MPALRSMIATLSGIQALWRALKPDETREALVMKCLVGCKNSNMLVPPALEAELSKYCEGGK